MNTKICAQCNLELEVICFSFKNKSKGIYNSWCKSCQKVYKDKHYEDNKAAYIAKSHRSRKTGQMWLLDLLKQSSCMDCGLRDPVVLEFDHVRGEKIANVTKLVSTQASRRRVEEEIAKCEIVCANCHKRRTYTRCNSYRTASSSNG